MICTSIMLNRQPQRSVIFVKVTVFCRYFCTVFATGNQLHGLSDNATLALNVPLIFFTRILLSSWYFSSITGSLKLALHEKCPYSEFSWSVFLRIRTEYENMRSISPYSVQMREIADQKNSEYGQFSRSVDK